jgi:hypothetical protein
LILMAARPVRRRSASRLAWLCLAATGLLAAPVQALPPAAEESQIKAQFFERFTRFIEWPPSTLKPSAPFVVCLAGGGLLAAEIERRMTRSSVQGHPTRVRRLAPGPTPDVAGCHALYLAPDTRPQLSALLARARGQPILTVGDSDGFCQQGALINMYIEDRFVRFEINAPTLRASGLRTSSKLLRLARMLETPPP